jgi:hypothetical protein
MMNTHHIQRQNIEVHLHGTEQQGYDAQHLLREWCLTTLPEVLARTLAPFDNDPRVHVIVNLNLDLGTISSQDLHSALTSLLREELESVLRDTFGKQSHGYTDRDENLVSLDRPAARLEAVLYFFKHGRLPWWFTRDGVESIEEMLFGTDAGSKTTPSSSRYQEFLLELRETLLSNSSARQRVMMQLSPPAALRLVYDMIPTLQPVIANVLTAIGKPPIPTVYQNKLQAGLVQVLLLSIGSGQENDVPTHASVPFTIRSAVGTNRAALLPAEQRELLAMLGLDQYQLDYGSELLAKDHGIQEPEELRFSEDVDVFTRDGLLVRNTGIVLLHPFLPQFLRATNLAVDDEIRDIHRAMLLIHHLSTGALTADEDELLLPKVLCGVPVEMPIERCTPITDFERDEANGLLRAVIQYWDALRTTTPDGLRGNFLTRLGRLDLHDSEWLLRVERESHDILLDHLPWGFSHFKLPWMDRILRVEW